MSYVNRGYPRLVIASCRPRSLCFVRVAGFGSVVAFNHPSGIAASEAGTPLKLLIGARTSSNPNGSLDLLRVSCTLSDPVH